MAVPVDNVRRPRGSAHEDTPLIELTRYARLKAERGNDKRCLRETEQEEGREVLRPSNDRIATAISSVRITRRRIREYIDTSNLSIEDEARLLRLEQLLRRTCSMLGDDRPLYPVGAEPVVSTMEGDDGEVPF